jgi:hypothetical protein
MFIPCKRSGARYRSKWYIDEADGALLFGLGVHGQYLFVDAEKLVVANVCPGSCRSTLRTIATLRAVSAVRRALGG